MALGQSGWRVGSRMVLGRSGWRVGSQKAGRRVGSCTTLGEVWFQLAMVDPRLEGKYPPQIVGVLDIAPLRDPQEWQSLFHDHHHSRECRNKIIF